MTAPETADSNVSAPSEYNAQPIAFGAYVFGAPGDPAELDAFARETGRMPAIVMWYEQWAGWDQGRLRRRDLEVVASRGAVPMITWDPWDPTAGLCQPAFHLNRIVQGDFDAYIDSWANGLATFGRPVYLRFGHEMNGDWYLWCPGVNGNTDEDYVDAWRHIHRRFTSVGTPNVQWVWSPNIEYAGSRALASLYPGDAFVDWLGIDGYNWGTSRAGKSWESFADLFGPSYRELKALTSKPIMIAETASSEVGGDKAAWISDAFLTQLPVHFPAVRAVIWFNENKETDWRAASSPSSLASFREAIAHPYFGGRLPR